MGKPIHGKIVAAKIRTTVKKEAAALFDAYGIHPGLAIIQVGNEPLSQLYTQIQLQACSDMDFHVSEYKMNNGTAAGFNRRIEQGSQNSWDSCAASSSGTD